MRSFILNLVFLILSTPSLLAETQPLASVKTYSELVSAIRHVRAESRERVERAIDREKVREAWETGKLIQEHILLNKKRADYGEQVLDRLAKDLESSRTELSYMLQFARAYPILPQGENLSWSHYRALLDVKDWEQREEILAEAVRQHWGRDQLRAEVRRRNTGSGVLSKLERLSFTPPGKAGAYRVVLAKAGKYKGRLVIDLGFSNYYSPAGKFNFNEGDIIQSVKGKLKKLDGGSDDDRYTYEADVIEVIDGDTFTAVIDLGFGFNTVQKLRLRGLDAPELPSTDGLEAKAFLEKSLRGPARPEAIPVLIRTAKSDKYDRYLADVFADGEYVNQKLVDQGLAVVVED